MKNLEGADKKGGRPLDEDQNNKKLEVKTIKTKKLELKTITSKKLELKAITAMTTVTLLLRMPHKFKKNWVAIRVQRPNIFKLQAS